MRPIVWFSLFLLSACVHSPAPPDGESISGEIVIETTAERGARYGVQRSSAFDHDYSRAMAEAELARKAYHHAFGAFLAACDPDHPENCYRAADILDRHLFSRGPFAVHSQAFAQDLFSAACDQGVTEACARLTVSE